MVYLFDFFLLIVNSGFLSEDSDVIVLTVFVTLSFILRIGSGRIIPLTVSESTISKSTC